MGDAQRVDALAAAHMRGYREDRSRELLDQLTSAQLKSLADKLKLTSAGSKRQLVDSIAPVLGKRWARLRDALKRDTVDVWIQHL